MSSYQKENYEKETAPTRINELCEALNSGGKCLSDEILAFKKKACSINFSDE